MHKKVPFYVFLEGQSPDVFQERKIPINRKRGGVFVTVTQFVFPMSHPQPVHQRKPSKGIHLRNLLGLPIITEGYRGICVN